MVTAAISVINIRVETVIKKKVITSNEIEPCSSLINRDLNSTVRNIPVQKLILIENAKLL